MMSLDLCLRLATKVESNQGTKLKANGRFGDEQEKNVNPLMWESIRRVP